jgi:peptidoglycan/LPS O-acetylase OafA/YrhL
MSLKRDAAWLAVAVGLGVVVLPWVVYFTGHALFGPYANGGPGRFFADFLGGLALLRVHSWTIALGPLLAVAVWRLLTRLRSAPHRDRR